MTVEETQTHPCNKRKTLKRKRIQNDTQILTPSASIDQIEVGILFKDKDTVKKCMNNIAITRHQQYKVEKSCTQRYYIRCVDPTCIWRFHSLRSRGSELFKVVNFEKRHSSINFITSDMRNATSKVIAEYITDLVRHTLQEITPKFVIEEMRSRYGLHISYHKAFANIKWTADNEFKYAFFAYGASIEGWKHCKPVMIVDATFLKSKYRDSENNESYRWFFRHVKKVFGTRKDLSILFDRHTSITTAIKELYPDTQHGICIYHMEKNLQKYFPSEAILSLFYNAVTTYKQAEFRTYMSQIQQIDPKAAEYIEEEPPEIWARSFHTNRHYNMLITNNVETMNSVLRKARELPIMVENITPIKFVVKDKGYQYNVDLQNMTCECLEFQTNELPCTHAMAVIDKRSLPKSIYCADWFKKQAWQETYKGEILSVGNQDSWIIPQNIMDIKITPPDVKIRPGRKQTKRYRSRRESTKYTYRCGRCKFFGHTRATCITVFAKKTNWYLKDYILVFRLQNK
ncbi:uncharacterized protein LOC132612730 [Lycium barbarum]|uniref:uncharacterized protein LOC132612730 n=1 Tax=Lycium barbarum TaxID=112863 RepID=UPI00293F5B0F|nr:uncharacterized protein LOC132612730 [Lycium barbarum]